MLQTAVFCGSKNIFCQRPAAVVLRKVEEGLGVVCGQYGSFAVFAAAYLQFTCGCWTAKNSGLNRISMKRVSAYLERLFWLYARLVLLGLLIVNSTLNLMNSSYSPLNGPYSTQYNKKREKQRYHRCLFAWPKWTRISYTYQNKQQCIYSIELSQINRVSYLSMHIYSPSKREARALI